MINLDSDQAHDQLHNVPDNQLFQCCVKFNGVTRTMTGYFSGDTGVCWMTKQDDQQPQFTQAQFEDLIDYAMGNKHEHECFWYEGEVTV